MVYFDLFLALECNSSDCETLYRVVLRRFPFHISSFEITIGRLGNRCPFLCTMVQI